MQDNILARQAIEERELDGYKEFEKLIKDNFNSLVGENTPLFLTDVDNLWDIYLNNLPEYGRQHYNCRCCRHFIERFGSLVVINEAGQMESALWSDNAPEFFKKSATEMRKAVLNSRVKNVFVAEERVLGNPSTGIWSHLSITVPVSRVNKSRLYTANQIIAEKSEDYRMLSVAIQEYSIDTVNTAVGLLNTEELYRGDKCLGVATWFKGLHEVLFSANGSRAKENLRWLAVATAPTGFCHIKSSMIGTLLEDIQSGMRFEAVSRRFASKMDPSNYMRSQSAPTQGAILEAERMVEKLGIANSLERRFATIDEIPEFMWRIPKFEKTVESKSTGIFGNITPKEKLNTNAPVQDMNLPLSVMTWEKFKRTILPTAKSIEAKVENPNRLMALVTAKDSTAENILQWDNTFSWYYHGGIDAEIKKRVEEAGGQYENNDIRCSLLWNSYTDLDLHCMTPDREHIHFGNKRTSTGYLDVDMNVKPTTNTPVENIRFFKGRAQAGIYEFLVHNYSDRAQGNNPYKVELEIEGRIYIMEGVSTGTGYKKLVFKFEYIPGREPRMITQGASESSSRAVEDWNVNLGFQKVNGITVSPNLWGDNEVSHSGTHVFFLLDGCKDLSEGKGRGFFNEMLKPELRPMRKTLEAYMADAPIDDVEDASASGLGFSKDSEWNVTLRVVTDMGTRLIKIDRWD